MHSNSKRHDSTPQAGRPDLPTSYGIQRSIEGVLGWDFVEERIRAARNYWVVTCSRGGRPHTTPVWGLWMQQAFYFSADAGSRKARNLGANPSVIVHLERGDEVVILQGEAHVVSDGSLIQRLSTEYFTKYAVRLEGGPVFEVRPVKAPGLARTGFPFECHALPHAVMTAEGRRGRLRCTHAKRETARGNV